MTRLSSLVTALLAVAVAGCGGKSGTLEGPRAADVAAKFHTLTGATLRPQGQSTPDWTLYDSGSEVYEQYGVFSVYVVKTDRGRKILLSDRSGKPLPRDGAVYWDRASDGSYSATRQFGANVIVVWQAGKERRTDAHFQALSRAMAAATTPGKANVLPAAERPCAADGIDLVSGREGTCMNGSVKVTVVNAASVLHTPVMDAKLLGTATTKTISSNNQFEPAKRARGTFVAVALRVNNTGDQPLQLIDFKLMVDGMTYTDDSGVEFYLNRDDPYPIQPGEQATVRAAFDVPPAAADRARAAGQISLPAGRFEGSDSLDDSAAQGRIRLAGAPASALPKGAVGANTVDRRKARVERAVRQLFAAIRSRNVDGVCSRLTQAALARYGGRSGCARYTVTSSAAGQVPPAGRKLTFDTLLTRSRATVFVRARGYRAILGLVKQGGTWRVAGFKKTS